MLTLALQQLRQGREHTEGEHPRLVVLALPDLARALERAASDPTTSTDGSGAGLVVPGTSEFLGLIRPRTILGRLGQLRKVPFYDGAALARGP